MQYDDMLLGNCLLTQSLMTVLILWVAGVSVLMGPLLRQVPLAVLFGVFLYMGVASMSGVQLLHRVQLVFMPVKHHPDGVGYVRRVSLLRFKTYLMRQRAAACYYTCHLFCCGLRALSVWVCWVHGLFYLCKNWWASWHAFWDADSHGPKECLRNHVSDSSPDLYYWQPGFLLL